MKNEKRKAINLNPKIKINKNVVAIENDFPSVHEFLTAIVMLYDKSTLPTADYILSIYSIYVKNKELNKEIQKTLKLKNKEMNKEIQTKLKEEAKKNEGKK